MKGPACVHAHGWNIDNFGAIMKLGYGIGEKVVSELSNVIRKQYAVTV